MKYLHVCSRRVGFVYCRVKELRVRRRVRCEYARHLKIHTDPTGLPAVQLQAPLLFCVLLASWNDYGVVVMVVRTVFQVLECSRTPEKLGEENGMEYNKA